VPQMALLLQEEAGQDTDRRDRHIAKADVLEMLPSGEDDVINQ
jgi:hypothetical protein